MNTKSKILSTGTARILTAPICEWPHLTNSDKRRQVVGTLQEVEGELSSLIQRAVLLRGYIAHRFNTGCGDQGHEASAKYANRTLVKIRKAMGFSYPKNVQVQIQ